MKLAMEGAEKNISPGRESECKDPEAGSWPVSEESKEVRVAVVK